MNSARTRSSIGGPLLLFFLSGANGLVLEVVWSKQLSFLLGNSLFAVSTVVAAFRAGLGLGSALAGRIGARLRSPLRAYGLLQLGIGLWGIASMPVLKGTAPLFRAIYSASAGGAAMFLAARFATVFALLVLPTIAMGMTLPLLVGALGRGRESFSREAALLYGINTMGAVVGTLSAGFLLLPLLGLTRSAVVAGLLDLLVGTLAIALARRRDSAPANAASSAEGALDGRRAKLVALLFAVSGFAALAVEVAWFRLLGLTLGPSTYAFSSMLAVYLAGIGLGSAAVARLAGRPRVSALATLALFETGASMLVIGELIFANRLPSWNLALHHAAEGALGANAFVAAHLGLAAILVFAPCLLLGAIFPFVIGALREASPRAVAPEAAVGRLYFWNTVGSIAGSLLTGFVGLPHLGAWHSIGAAGLLFALVGLGFWGLSSRSARGVTRIAPLVLGGLALLLLLAAPRFDAAQFNRGLYRSLYSSGAADPAHQGGRLIFQREGTNVPVAVYRSYGDAALFLGGKPDASTSAGDLPTQLLSGHLPVFACRSPRRALMIGYGSGMTATALLDHPEVESLDLLELEPGVIEASHYFDSINHDPLSDPRLHLKLEDGRVHLAYTREQYDVISSEPSNPWMAGTANLFTVEFYRLVAARLAPGGVFAQWVQNYDISAEVQTALLASIRSVFPHLVLFRTGPGDIIVLASMTPFSLPWSEVERRFAVPAVARGFREIGIDEPAELAFFLQVPESTVEGLTRGVRPLSTDDSVWLEHRMPREMFASRGRAPGRGIGLTRAGSEARLAARRRFLAGCSPAAPLSRVGPLSLSTRTGTATDPRASADRWHETRHPARRAGAGASRGGCARAGR
ncbi:MAG: fused MFS/spermidine synthase [Candidatus Eisenbacteria bacterium]